jgi:hypothetical protein
MILRKGWSSRSVEGQGKGKAQEHLLGEAGGSGEGEQRNLVKSRNSHCTHGQCIKSTVRWQRAQFYSG